MVHLKLDNMDIIRHDKASLKELPSRFRGHMCNSLPGFKSTCLIGTVNNQGIENLAVFSQLIHVGSNPAMMGLLFRPHTVRRDTLENIRSTNQFTINHIHASFVAQAHQTAAKYEASESEFDAVNLTPEYTETIKAPYVQESQIKIGLSLCEEVTVQSNQTILVVGAVEEIRFPAHIQESDGYLDLVKSGTVAGTNSDAYFNAVPISRFAYAQPGKPTLKI